MRFGGLAYAAGLKQNERIVPPGFPVPVGQVSHRFRFSPEHKDALQRASMWQIGPGVFAANATPPYKSWDEFRPIVEMGVEALIDTRPEMVKRQPFSHVSLRYIDAFTEDFLQGRSSSEFLSQSLSIGVQLPPVFNSLLKENGQIETAVQFKMPLNDLSTLTFSASPGVGPSGPALIVLTAIDFVGEIDVNISAVMGRLDAARRTIHDSFVDMTKKIHHVMQPLEG